MILREKNAFTSVGDEVVIRVENVSKKFSKSLKRSMIYGIKDTIKNIFKSSAKPDILRKGEFWAVNNISFELKMGECFGIIGPNGSGKTTLLSMLNGIFMPDTGTITIKGKTGALIAVGAGFHPMLTGRENIYIKGAIMGMSKAELDSKFDTIVEFADIGDFLDMPVKNYSSGMFVRLGFSVAVHCEPEILLIDEVLSVGDLSFQNKCLQRLDELREKTNAVVLVSHNLEHVRTLCDRVLVLNSGKPVFLGTSTQAIQKYEEITRDKRLKNLERTGGLSRYLFYSSGDIEFLEGGIMNELGKQIDAISIDDDVITFIRFRVKNSIDTAIIAISILNTRHTLCIWQFSNDKDPTKFYKFDRGEYLVKAKFKKPRLAPGVYTISYSIRDQKSGEIYEKNIGFVAPFKVTGKAFERSVIYVESEWDVEKIKMN